MTVTVPFYDLSFQHDPLLVSRIKRDVERLAASGAFTNGPEVTQFESAWAKRCGRSYGVGTGSGLDALRLTLLALDVGPGDEVLVPAMTFLATWEAVTQTGATPVAVDVDPNDYTMDVSAANASVTGRTKAIVPVHLYGMPANVPELAKLGIPVVADACQAHGFAGPDEFGAQYSIADCYSFYPSKNLGAWGDAGAVVTHVPELAVRIASLREHGRAEYPEGQHTEPGWTSRLDTIQAAILLRKLPFLDEWTSLRRNAAQIYGGLLNSVGDLIDPYLVADGRRSVCHLYVVRSQHRDDLREHLAEAGIDSRIHYPIPPPNTDAYDEPRGRYPVAESLAATGLSLPFFPGITFDQQEQVAEAIRAFFHG